MRTPREVAEEAVAEIVLTSNFEQKRRILAPIIAAWGVELLDFANECCDSMSSNGYARYQKLRAALEEARNG